MPQIVTANRLHDGCVVFLTATGEWSEKVAVSALAANDDAAADLLAIATRAELECAVIAPYLIAVEGEGDGLRPVTMREVIRAQGPTVQSLSGLRVHHVSL